MAMIDMPHSDICEQSLIGLLMVNPTIYDLIGDRLPASDFFVPMHGAMYNLCGELLRAGIEFTPAAIATRLSDKFGSERELYQICINMFEAAGYATDVSSLACCISDLALQRKLIVSAGKLTDAARGNKPDEAKKHQEEISSLARSFSAFVAETPEQQLREAFQQAIGGVSMMQTGMRCWDESFGGIFREKIYTISGSGGAGKSALAINLAWNMAKSGRKVRWVSWEEDRSALWWRILARETNTPVTSFRKGLTEHQQGLISERQHGLLGADFLTYYKLKNAGQIIDAAGQADLIVIDGMSRYPAPSDMAIVDRVNYVMAACNDICLRTGAAVLLLSHVNSESAKGGASISGLYGGQAATFDPEGIVDIRRSDDTIHADGRRAVTLSVLKNRYGPEGLKMPLWFFGEYMRFEE